MVVVEDSGLDVLLWLITGAGYENDESSEFQSFFDLCPCKNLKNNNIKLICMK